MELEDAFDLSIPDEDVEKMQTVGDAVKYINEHTHKNCAQGTIAIYEPLQKASAETKPSIPLVVSRYKMSHFYLADVQAI